MINTKYKKISSLDFGGVLKKSIHIVLLIILLGVVGFSVNTALADSTSSLDTPLTKQEAQKLLTILNDPKEREAFSHTLSLMARAAPSNNHTALKNKTDIHNGLESLHAQSLSYFHNFLGLFIDLRFLMYEIHDQFSSQNARKIIYTTTLLSIIFVALGLGIEHLTTFILKNPIQRISLRVDEKEKTHDRYIQKKEEQNSPPPSPEDISDKTTATRTTDQKRRVETLRFLARVPYAFILFLLKIFPVGVFFLLVTLSTLLFPFLSDSKAGSIIMTLASCYAGARCLYFAIETIFSPHNPNIRLIPTTNLIAARFTRWLGCLILAPTLIICFINLNTQLNISSRALDALIRAIVLIEHILIALFIWRMRHVVSNALTPTAAGKSKKLWSFFATIAKAWWIPAMFIDISLWIVWAAHLSGGYHWILTTTGITVAILIVSRIVAVLAYGLQDRFFRLNPALNERFPDLQKRADHYYPLAHATLTGIIVFLTIISIVEAWGFPIFGFFLKNSLGQHISNTGVITIVSIIIAILIWETINIILINQINHFQNAGFSSRATRLKTILPIIRTVFLIIIIVTVIVTILAQIGINITPLLTGAGIMGAAIAFGSQSLVKDFITGFFMLVEDAIQVGDWVTTGGVSGIVENLSIRTVKIRDTDGDLHIIPFSSVTSIANTARGYNKIIIKQQLDLSEDFSRVVSIMTKVVKDMRADDVFGPLILSDYNDLGVDKTDSSGATLRGEIWTTPMMKWKVQREFYKRIANLFAAEKIKFYTGTSYFTTPPGSPMQVKSIQIANDVTPTTPQDS
ncbi:mechanosensitive ion channel domain-containing protein [Swingsia samuiensis]|uniref:Mechanosensitive ion channel n=1 Tax=Swingsia samuiensis TaxID=1293412 RepID=A0A4Y6UGP5_9PROT|nr:mechanosensitive ion channel domain-containing protein [Swingsia samuiensis]QDH16723.1 mechanosensitive ion channel [Swingsia samuiensis]